MGCQWARYLESSRCVSEKERWLPCRKALPSGPPAVHWQREQMLPSRALRLVLGTPTSSRATLATSPAFLSWEGGVKATAHEVGGTETPSDLIFQGSLMGSGEGVWETDRAQAVGPRAQGACGHSCLPVTRIFKGGGESRMGHCMFWSLH